MESLSTEAADSAESIPDARHVQARDVNLVC